jgi:hypothetical protein
MISSVPSRALRDGQGADRVVGDHAARVADDVRVALLQAEHARQQQPRVHARHHGDLLGRWHRQVPLVEARGVALVVGQQLVGDAHAIPH